MASSKVWLVTGASRGFGRVWAEAALKRGDRVVATARNPEKLNDLDKIYGDAVMILPLDVTDRDAVFDAVGRAHRHFGQLDVVLTSGRLRLYGRDRRVGARASQSQLRNQRVWGHSRSFRPRCRSYARRPAVTS